MSFEDAIFSLKNTLKADTNSEFLNLLSKLTSC